MRKKALSILRGAGVEEALGQDHLFPTRPALFGAMDDAIAAALEVVGQHGCSDACPLRGYLEHKAEIGVDGS